MPQAQLRWVSSLMIAKSGEASAIVKEYLSYSMPRKRELFITYRGKRYTYQDARYLLDDLESDEGG